MIVRSGRPRRVDREHWCPAESAETAETAETTESAEPRKPGEERP
jgi:hypothetical protein